MASFHRDRLAEFGKAQDGIVDMDYTFRPQDKVQGGHFSPVHTALSGLEPVYKWSARYRSL